MNQAERETYAKAFCAACGRKNHSDIMLEKVTFLLDAVYDCGLADGNAEGWKQARITLRGAMWEAGLV